jgi:hypothetical protein
MYGTIGPSRAFAASDGRLHLLSHGKIHLFAPDGSRAGTMDLDAIGAPRRPSDFEVHGDGRVVLTNPDAPELVRCAWPAGPCERIAVGLRSVPAQEVLPLNAAKLHIDEAGQRYFIADNSGHRVLVTDLRGSLLAATTPRLLQHPNQLSLAAPDRLTVVDTDHRQLATFDISGGGFQAAPVRVSTHAADIARPGRGLPFDAVRLPQGEVAVLVAADGMKDADLVFYDAAGKALRRADLAADSDPFDIELWRGRLWVADASRYRFDSVGLDGKRGGGIEDKVFLEELARERDAVAEWRDLRRMAQVGVVVIPLLGALLIWRLGAPQPAQRAVEPMPRHSASVQWLDLQPAFARRVRIAAHGFAWAILIGLVAWIALFMVRYRDSVFSAWGIVTVLPALAVPAVGALLFFFAYRTIPRRFEGTRLGAAEDALHFSVPVARLAGFKRASGSAAWKDVYFDGSRLLAGRQLIIIAPFPFGRLFAPDRLEALIVARIPRENRVSRAQLLQQARPL